MHAKKVFLSVRYWRASRNTEETTWEGNHMGWKDMSSSTFLCGCDDSYDIAGAVDVVFWLQSYWMHVDFAYVGNPSVTLYSRAWRV